MDQSTDTSNLRQARASVSLLADELPVQTEDTGHTQHADTRESPTDQELEGSIESLVSRQEALKRDYERSENLLRCLRGRIMGNAQRHASRQDSETFEAWLQLHESLEYFFEDLSTLEDSEALKRVTEARKLFAKHLPEQALKYDDQAILELYANGGAVRPVTEAELSQLTDFLARRSLQISDELRGLKSALQEKTIYDSLLGEDYFSTDQDPNCITVDTTPLTSPMASPVRVRATYHPTGTVLPPGNPNPSDYSQTQLELDTNRRSIRILAKRFIVE